MTVLMVALLLPSCLPVSICISVFLYEDLASSIPHALSAAAALESTSCSSQSSSLSVITTTAAATAVSASQFTQREITISPTTDQLQNDFGGVWLGEENDDSAASAAIDVGGKRFDMLKCPSVWLVLLLISFSYQCAWWWCKLSD